MTIGLSSLDDTGSAHPNCNGSGVQVPYGANRPPGGGPRARIAEYPVLQMNQSYAAPTIECQVAAAAVTHAAGRE